MAMALAVAAARGGGSVNSIYGPFGVKRTALQGRVNGKVAFNAKQGGKPSLSGKSLDALAEKCREDQANDEPMNMSAVRAYAASLAAAAGRPYRKDTPSRSATYTIKAELKLRGIYFGTPNATSKARIDAHSVAVMSPYFASLQRTFTRHPILLQEPQRICALDESPLHQQTQKIPASEKVAYDPKLQKNRPLRRSVIGDGTSHVTLISAITADGGILPNGYVNKGKFLQMGDVSLPHPPSVTEKELDRLYSYRTASGFTTKVSFAIYIKEHVVVNLRVGSPTGPLLLLFDNPSVHDLFNEEGWGTWLHDNDIIIRQFPANTSTYLDPCDLTLFGALKKAMASLIDLTSSVHVRKDLFLDAKKYRTHRKPTIPPTIALVRAQGFEHTATPRTLMLMSEQIFHNPYTINYEVVREGFQLAGIYPFDPHVVLSKCPDFAPTAPVQQQPVLAMTDAAVGQAFQQVAEVAQDFTLTPVTRKRRIVALMSALPTPRTVCGLSGTSNSVPVPSTAAQSEGRAPKVARQLTFSTEAVHNVGVLRKRLQEKNAAATTKRRQKVAKRSSDDDDDDDEGGTDAAAAAVDDEDDGGGAATATAAAEDDDDEDAAAATDAADAADEDEDDVENDVACILSSPIADTAGREAPVRCHDTHICKQCLPANACGICVSR